MDKRHRNPEQDSRQTAVSAAAQASRDSSSPSSPSTTRADSQRIAPPHGNFGQLRQGGAQAAPARNVGHIESGGSGHAGVTIRREDITVSGERKRESEATQGDSDSRAGKKTRVEGRGSSAAQRAAASEACKGITLNALQAQYYRPLSDVAKDLRVSVARLLKKCREFGILRWPYRHVRSVQESIEQLERDREAATDPVAVGEMDVRLELLRRRGELVMHFASCGLEADMRKGIFLADPRDVDNMINKAHEAHGRRRASKGWEVLGQFPDLAVREHFLEQMRAHMVGGGGTISTPEAPRDMVRPQDDPMSSTDKLGDPLHRQHKMHPQGSRAAPPLSRQHSSWHEEQPQPPPPWQHGQHPYHREVDKVHYPYPSPYWTNPHGAGIPGPAGRGAGSPIGVGPGGVVGDSGRGGGGPGGEFNRVRSPGRADYPSSEPISYPPPASSHWPIGGSIVPPTPRHHRLEGRAKSEPLRSIDPGPPRVNYNIRGIRGVGGMEGMEGGGAGGGIKRRDGFPGPWGEDPGGGGSSATPEDQKERGGGHREIWRHSGRLTPSPSHLGTPARRGWVSGDLANPAGREMPQPGTTALPSIFERQIHLERSQNFLSPTPGPVPIQPASSPTAARPSRPPGIGEGQGMGPSSSSIGTDGGSRIGIDSTAPRESQWPGPFQEPSAVGFDNRWGTPQTIDRRPAPAPPPPPARRLDEISPGRNDPNISRLQARNRSDLSPSVTRSPASRFSVASVVGTGGGVRGVGPTVGQTNHPTVPRDPPWPGPPRAGMSNNFVDRRYVGSTGGSHRGAFSPIQGAEQGPSSRQASSSTTSASRDSSWSQQQGTGQEHQGGEGSRRSSSDVPRDSHY